MNQDRLLLKFTRIEKINKRIFFCFTILNLDRKTAKTNISIYFIQESLSFAIIVFHWVKILLRFCYAIINSIDFI